MSLTTVILTFNEERHIARAIASVDAISDKIVIVDSGSTDRTTEVAQSLGAQVLKHPFINQAAQFNWALEQLSADTDWVLRLDADEILSAELAQGISIALDSLDNTVKGLSVSRRIAFLGRTIYYGGLFPVKVVRLFRYGSGRSEDRWMDEHIVVDGTIVEIPGEILDNNLNPLGWWIEKHNQYACREAIELLNLKHGFLSRTPNSHLRQGRSSAVKRWLKNQVYNRLPIGFRALIYFLYRYLLRFGFLDGREGTAFHVLQGFWYRYLVDLRLYEVSRYMRDTGAAPKEAVATILGVALIEDDTKNDHFQRAGPNALHLLGHDDTSHAERGEQVERLLGAREQ